MIAAFAGYSVAHIVREDDQFVLLRATRDADGVPVLVLCARHERGTALARIEHEYALRAELDPAWAATPLELVHGAACPALVLADGAAPLQVLQIQPGQPLAPAALVQLGAAIAHALSQLHRHDIVHRDLRPEHILIDAAGAVRLTGFGIATRLRALPQLPEDQISGSLAYMAPEQTGRMNRAVDTRADLYSFGVLLYQLLCGELPFCAAGPTQWIHCHVARAPPAPNERCPGADPTLSAMVLKLLSKTAEQRYQSAAGLHADLQHCQSMLAAHGTITPFALAASDGPARLQVPASLVGRAAQLAVLESAALQVASGAGAAMVILSGLAGTGKSALLAALQQSQAAAGALVLAAKFEQHGRDIPYATLAGAVRQLVRRMLGQSEAALAAWRSRLLAALGPDADLMRELIPELGFVIGARDPGSEAPAQALAPPQAQARFQGAFRQLLGAVAEPDTMLLLCLDDLQWIDPASLKLLTYLLTHPGARRVCVAGACRAGVVDGAHPLALAQAQDAMRRQGMAVHEVVLAALTRSEAGELVAAALACTPPACAPLAALVYSKSAGNPFFTLQFLTRLLESGLLRYRRGANCWEWDAAAISARQFSDNVIDLMIARLQQLPYSTLEVVKLLACLGAGAGLDTLAQAAGMSIVEADESLWPAARLGLVLRDAHAYRFTHDRVQEAAYSLIARASLPERHLHLGRLLLLLLGRMAPLERGREVFAVVRHLNLAREAIDDPAELAQLAGLNAQAGARARAAVAFDAARHYYQAAAALTPPAAWDQAPGATFDLYSALAEAEYLCGYLERADSLCALLDTHAFSRLELARVALMRLALYQVWGRFEQAVAVALEALARFGVSLPEGPEALAAERAAVAANLAGRSMAELEREALSTDPELAIVAELFTDMGSSVFSARPKLYPLLALKALNFTLRFGATAGACVAYSRYAILQVSQGAIAEAFAFSQLALDVAGRGGAPARRAGRLRFVHGAYVHPWRRPVAHSVALLEQACAECQEAGDLPHAGYAAHNATWTSFEAGAPLHEVQERARHYQQLARQHNNELLMQLLCCYEQLTLCLQGATGSEGSFDDARFSGAAALAQMEQGGFGVARARFYLMRQVAAFTFGRYQEALEAAEAAACERHFLLASVAEATHYFYHALCMTALYPGAAPQLQARFMAALHDIAGKLRAWAGHCAGNFDNRYLLVMAELARIGDRVPEAQRAYSAALASARAGGFVHNEALAAELAARFYAGRGFERPALAYARAALEACGRWGAYGKMRQLERQFPGLVRVPAPLPAPLAGLPGPAVPGGARLAAAPLARPPAPLAGPPGPVDIEGLLRGAIELAGAGRGLLLLPGADGYRCAAEGWSGADGVQITSAATPARPAGAALPQALLQFVLRTRETVLLDDAQASAQFAGDPYLCASGARSVLCMALPGPRASAAVLYLDNALAPGLFSLRQVQLLEQLAAKSRLGADLPRSASLP